MIWVFLYGAAAFFFWGMFSRKLYHGIDGMSECEDDVVASVLLSMVGALVWPFTWLVILVIWWLKKDKDITDSDWWKND
jgi:hypothetical protein